MDIVSLCPLRAWGFVWQAQDGRFAQTIVVKATFVLTPGRASLAPEQEAPNQAERHRNDDPSRSVHAPSDKVPYKPRADVILVGHAYAPGQQPPVRTLTTRLTVGDLDKSIELWCDRVFRAQDGQLLEGPRFTKMPLLWERAAGGPETNNPVGMRFDAPPDTYGVVPIPNLQPPGIVVSERSDTFAPICFGPVAETWPGRMQRLGRLAGTFPKSGWEEHPLPAGLDPAYFQAAPPDQVVAEIRPNERIVLENLHPEHARLVTNLPGLRPRVVVDRATGEQEQVALVADTLLIDTDRGICVVVWRGRIGLRHAAEAGRITVKVEGDGVEELDEDLLQTIPPSTAAEVREEESDLAGMTLAPGFDMAKAAGPVLPFLGAASAKDGAAAAAPRGADGALPFRQQGGLAALRAVEAAAVPVSAEQTVFAPSTPSPVATPAAAPSPLVPPAYVAAPPPPAPPVAASVSPWASGGHARREEPPVAVTAPGPAPVPSSGKPEGPGVLGMSNQAANKSEWRAPTVEGGASAPTPAPILSAVRPAARTADPRDAIALLWFDSSSVRRMRKHKSFREVLEKAESKPAEPELDHLSADDSAAEVDDRRDVFEIVTHASSVDAPGVTEALERSIRDDGKVIPHLVLCAGEFVTPFDEVERLKATVATVTPLSAGAGDENLKASLQIAREFLGQPSLSSAPAVAEGLVKRIVEGFGQSKRAVTVDYVEAQVERALLEQRHYQRRKVFGGKHLRCLLVMGGSKDPIPTYLPEALAEELPMYARFRVRIVAEVRMAEDQYEVQPVALRGLAVGRTFERTRR
ncbi:DUF2169 family type VI secretion system accessory protein [Polyangium aurulentum]|uniref:DUF2169 family type VI secretion system accessory protein n=1 Tax=Polyangium aurulentum TaxID=2567896 RepID=UPI0010AE6FF0|nr:DUF2169 domain-containing protein [Polyangium aurulentum]UQA61362.1 DUF2169 domain-containing protein [Polyangium aurulentum]